MASGMMLVVKLKRTWYEGGDTQVRDLPVMDWSVLSSYLDEMEASIQGAERESG